MSTSSALGSGKGGSDRAAYWRKIFNDWQASGLSKNAFCKTHGINSASFYRWFARLGTKQPSKPKLKRTSTTSTFVPVKVLESSVSEMWSCEILLPNGCEIRLKNFPTQDQLELLFQNAARRG